MGSSTVAQSVAFLADFYGRNASQMLQEYRLRPAAEEELRALESRIPGPLAADYRSFLLLNEVGHNFAGNYTCLDVAQVNDTWERMTGLLHDATFDGWVEQHIRDGFDNWDDDRLRRVWWSPAWVPIAEDSCGNLVCLDGDPGPRGVRHQVIKMEIQGRQGPFWADLDSFGDYLQAYCDQLRAGHYRLEDGWLVEVD